MIHQPLFAHAHATQPPPAPEEVLDQLLEDGSRHAAAAQASVFAVGLDMLGDIELPPSAATQVDRAQMRALGALYLAADLEPAGIISSAETLSSLASSGALGIDLGPVAGPLHAFWRKRHQRPDPSERNAFYARLFGVSYGPIPADGVANMAFEARMLELCEAIYRLDEQQARYSNDAPSANTARIRSAARGMLGNLSRAGGGITPFMATELMAALKEALAILKHPHLRGLFAARDVWDVIAGIRRRARMTGGDPRMFVDRGRAGMTIIVWLADAAERLRQYGQPIVGRGDPVIPAAVEWLQASLTISELHARTQAPAPPPPGQGGLWGQGNTSPASDWADLGV
ncbi:hypothetical protein [uncultured Roseobacter sp.]|uniref:hypothetical protein n=1 Tax=uncultured Roseobacter sp. TaxID=114847 RepID=UPI002619B966|nr:hypothetical protein [uncultured Roseobacter sp.]